MSAKQREIKGLIVLLHERMNDDENLVSFVTEEGDIDDYADSLLERLRCLVDAEYCECVYGSD